MYINPYASFSKANSKVDIFMQTDCSDKAKIRKMSTCHKNTQRDTLTQGSRCFHIQAKSVQRLAGYGVRVSSYTQILSFSGEGVQVYNCFWWIWAGESPVTGPAQGRGYPWTGHGYFPWTEQEYPWTGHGYAPRLHRGTPPHKVTPWVDCLVLENVNTVMLGSQHLEKMSPQASKQHVFLLFF